MKKQSEGFESSEIFKRSVEAKLNELHLEDKWWTNFEKCGVDIVWIGCFGCEKVTQKLYSCNSRWCPRCNWRISMQRRKLLEKITAGMTNVKHVVLTQRNFPDLTHKKIQESRKALLKLRRRLITTKVYGGCASLEFTNEGNGWHMHWHLLLHVRFLCQNCLAFEWGQLVNQEFGIVKVLDVTEKSYLGEVCKYAVKGSELASWTGKQIHEFITAQKETRMFSVFGTFMKVAQFARAALETEKVGRAPCECGCERQFAAKSQADAERIFRSQFV